MKIEIDENDLDRPIFITKETNRGIKIRKILGELEKIENEKEVKISSICHFIVEDILPNIDIKKPEDEDIKEWKKKIIKTFTEQLSKVLKTEWSEIYTSAT